MPSLFSSLWIAYVLSGVVAKQHRTADVWSVAKFGSLVSFGDSYTDEGRLGYIINHNLTLPPTGYFPPESSTTSDGGRIWTRYIVQYAGVKTYNYAVSGAVCSNNITPRAFQSILFPSVAEYEIPAYLNDSKLVDSSGKQVMDIPQDSTVYSIWIGTNDLGNAAFLTDSQVKGKTLVDYLDCVYAQLDALYKNGARYFVIQNNAPLQLAPQYAPSDRGGLTSTQYFPNKGSNITEISYRMLEQVVLTNDAFATRTGLYAKVTGRYPGAHLAVFNMYDLLSDIYYHPTSYLNGTAPLNVTGFVNQAAANGTRKNAPSPDSFMWYDELHPSEQTDRIIAREFIKVANGTSKWATYWNAASAIGYIEN